MIKTVAIVLRAGKELAWWYKHCHYSNLNGLYYGAADGRGDGIKWHNWHGYSMKKAQMKTRPSQF